MRLSYRKKRDLGTRNPQGVRGMREARLPAARMAKFVDCAFPARLALGAAQRPRIPPFGSNTDGLHLLALHPEWDLEHLRRQPPSRRNGPEDLRHRLLAAGLHKERISRRTKKGENQVWKV